MREAELWVTGSGASQEQVCGGRAEDSLEEAFLTLARGAGWCRGTSFGTQPYAPWQSLRHTMVSAAVSHLLT